MSNIKEYIESGILEAYVLGLTSPEEQLEVEEMAASHIEVREAMDEFSVRYQQLAEENTVVEPHPNIKPLLVATINYMGRIEKGEQPSNPPMLHEGSKISDYNEWLQRPDMALTEGFTDIYAKIVAHTPKATTAIVWINDMAPQEVHDNEFERFLIVEGTCTITVEEDAYQLQPGDYLQIPLFKNHKVTVTSDIPCKVILQRVAA